MIASPAYELAKAILTTISGDAEIEQYCQAKWSKSLSLFLGLDVKDPPADDLQPWLTAVPTSSGRADGWNAEEYGVTFGIEIESSGKTAVATGFTEITGLKVLEEFTLLVFKKICDDPVYQQLILGNPVPQFELDYPFFRSVWTITAVGTIQQ